MTANYARRYDLFADAGFERPERCIERLVRFTDGLGFESGGASQKVEVLVERAAQEVSETLSAASRRMLDAAPDWLFERGGDLAGLFWLLRTLEGHISDPFPVEEVVFRLAHNLWQGGRKSEAGALLRFFADLNFDWGDLYVQEGIAYGFFNSREPNPLVWKVLEQAQMLRESEPRLPKLRVMELGCGIGNDALGILTSPLVEAFEGTDLSSVALDRQRERVADALAQRPDLEYSLVAGDFLAILRQKVGSEKARPNLVYSYSSLHYFNSTELREIMRLVHALLPARTGLFAFGIKGKDSVWDGKGLPLYRPDVWLNHDGQSRWFPSRKALARLMDRYGFEIRLHELHEHWSYSETGKADVFHYVICSPRQ